MAQQQSLSPSTNHLVVCGALDKPRDEWLFGDFLGFASVLREHSVNGRFINSFDLKKYFAQTGLNDIKFGTRPEIADGEDRPSEDHISVYSRWDFEHRTPWWDQLKPQDAKGNGVVNRVLEWINECAQQTKAVDVVSIVLIGHGGPSGISLGGATLSPAALASACSALPQGVQVNIVVKACQSGVFAEGFKAGNRKNVYVHTSAKSDESSWSTGRSISGRTRNSVFGGAFVRTLGLMRDPEEIWTLSKQEDFRSTPVMLSDHDKRTKLMKDILSTEYVDVTYQDPPRRARRVMTPISPADQPPLPAQTESLVSRPAEYEALRAFVEGEFKFIDLYGPSLSEEMSLTEAWMLNWASPEIAAKQRMESFDGFVFRFLVQEKFFIVAEDLISHGFVSIEALYAPMALWKATPAVTLVKDVLSCFAFGRDCIDLDPKSTPGRPFSAAPAWLAVLIVRSCVNWQGLVNRLITLQSLGQLDVRRFEALLEKGLMMKTNPKECMEKSIQPCSFWLPQNTTIKEFEHLRLPRHRAITHLYKAITGVVWPGDPAFESTVARLLSIEENTGPSPTITTVS